MLEVSEEAMKGKEKAFIDCHSLLHQHSLSPESLSALQQDLKKRKI